MVNGIRIGGNPFWVQRSEAIRYKLRNEYISDFSLHYGDIIYIRPAVSASRSLVAVDDKGMCFFHKI